MFILVYVGVPIYQSINRLPCHIIAISKKEKKEKKRYLEIRSPISEWGALGEKGVNNYTHIGFTFSASAPAPAPAPVTAPSSPLFSTQSQRYISRNLNGARPSNFASAASLALIFAYRTDEAIPSATNSSWAITAANTRGSVPSTNCTSPAFKQ